MEAPPSLRPKKSNTGLIVGLLIGVVLLCCCGGGGLLYMGGRMAINQALPMVTCGVGLHDLQRAMNDYADAHDGTLPKAANWEDDIRPYYAKRASSHKDNGQIPSMPAAGPWGCGVAPDQTGFAFNSDLAGKKLSSIKDNDTVLIFEVAKPGKNQAMPYKELDANNSPKILGKPRGWMVVTVGGDAHSKTPKGGNVRFDNGME